MGVVLVLARQGEKNTPWIEFAVPDTCNAGQVWGVHPVRESNKSPDPQKLFRALSPTTFHLDVCMVHSLHIIARTPGTGRPPNEGPFVRKAALPKNPDGPSMARVNPSIAGVRVRVPKRVRGPGF